MSDELKRRKTQQMIDSILRRGGKSVRCDDLECSTEDIKELYEKRGWRVSKETREEDEDSVLLFETASERKLLQG